VSLSEQELVDCDSRDAGCNGGLPENAYKTLLEIGGLESEAEYGYDGEDEQCKFNRYSHIEQKKIKNTTLFWAYIQRQGSILAWIPILSVYGADKIAEVKLLISPFAALIS
jgi:hypothetical protein